MSLTISLLLQEMPLPDLLFLLHVSNLISFIAGDAATRSLVSYSMSLTISLLLQEMPLPDLQQQLHQLPDLSGE